jgi:hypothetical protein
MYQNFDDRLNDASTARGAIHRGRTMARERAREDAPADFCEACVDDTPLAYLNASDAHTVKWMDNCVQSIAAHIVGIDAALTDTWHIRSELTEAYRQAYFRACADPGACDVCRDDEAECGHARHGEVCPAREVEV